MIHGTGKVVNLIGDGYPINFFAAEFGGMGDRQADLTLSLLLISMISMAQGKYAKRKGVIKGEIDRLAAEQRIAERFMRYAR